MPAHRCNIHPDRGPQDRRPDGRCIHCSRDRQREYRARCREQIRRYRAIEAALTA